MLGKSDTDNCGNLNWHQLPRKPHRVPVTPKSDDTHRIVSQKPTPQKLKLKEDVVSFSHAKQQRNLKKDPHISDSKVNSVLDKLIESDKTAKRKITDNNFSKIYNDEQVNVRKKNKKTEKKALPPREISWHEYKKKENI